MKLVRVDIHGVASIREMITLHIDKRVTTLIGANDTGKRTYCEQYVVSTMILRSLPLTENWDLPADKKAWIEWTFELDLTDPEAIRLALASLLEAKGRKVTVLWI